MSNALALAGVTAVIKDLLDSGLIDHQVHDKMGVGVTVSALAPDSIQVANDAPPRLNLFLHQVTPNAAWRNSGFPTHNAAGQRVSNAPLALDLHYLLTAYGSADLQAEVLLGYAMQLLHETPVLARNAIRKALNPATPPLTGDLLPTVYQTLRASDLADQIEQIKITPAMMNTEELSKLWTALQAHYRPTATYQATVVLIESKAAARSALPVLTRGGTMPDPTDPTKKLEKGIVAQADLDLPYPGIVSITLPSSQIAALHGDDVELDGRHLTGANHKLLLSNARLDLGAVIPTAASFTADSVTFKLPPNQPTDYPAGIFTATLEFVPAGETVPRRTNALSLAIAPQITNLPSPLTLDADGNLAVTPTCIPELKPNQRVSLILGSIEAIADQFNTATTTPTFQFTKIPAGLYRARLRVDGVDSPMIDRKATPPVYVAPQLTVQP